MQPKGFNVQTDFPIVNANFTFDHKKSSLGSINPNMRINEESTNNLFLGGRSGSLQ